MTHQAYPLEDLQPCYTPHHTFFERLGYPDICVLLAEVLDNTPLYDPETNLLLPSLRQDCSQDGLCYAHVLYAFAEGLYWADVAATPDLANAEHVVLTEAQLLCALAWDERLFRRTPAQIRRRMQAQVDDLAPLSSRMEPAPPVTRFPAPVVPLSVVTTVEVTTKELRDAFESNEANHTPDTLTHRGRRTPGVCAVQQRLLRVLTQALQELLESATDWYTAKVLHTLSDLVLRVERWQRHTRQRVVNAVRFWDATSQRLAWALTLGVPQALLGKEAVVCCSGTPTRW
jgi:hypothetical protein